MLGSRKSAISVAEAAVKTRVKDIKKVDIDIMSTGESPSVEKSYYFKELTGGTPIENLYMDSDTGYMRFAIDADGISKVVQSLNLDADKALQPQLVTGQEGTRYELGFRLKQASGTHFMTLRILNRKTESTDIYTYRFQIIVREKNKVPVVDVPQVSYRDSLLNVTKLWLLSRKYDRVRKPDWAGFFDGRLRGYEMNEAGATKVQNDLSEAIKYKIQDIYISDIKAIPHPESRSWDVSVVTTDTDTQLSTLTADLDSRQVVVKLDEDA